MKRKLRAFRQSALRYSPKGENRSTVRRDYRVWRANNGVCVRCDNPACTFHTGELQWLGQPLPLILDHINGNNKDNRPENLRYLCPNCDSQLTTKGGGNRGRVESLEENGFVLKNKDQSREFNYFGSGSIKFAGSADVQHVKGAEEPSE